MLPDQAIGVTKVLRSDAFGVTLAFDFGDVRLSDVALPGTSGKAVGLADCVRFGAPGLPDLPQLRLLCGIAQQGDVRVSIRDEAVQEVNDCDIAPVPAYVAPEPDNPRSGEGKEVPSYRKDICYARDEFYPPELVFLEATELLRDVRVARLLISPVQYNPVRRALRVARHFVVSLDFARAAQVNDFAGQGRPDPFESIYPELLINGNTARQWKVSSAGTASEPRSFFDRSATWVKIAIESTGVYRVGYDDLRHAGFNPSLIDPATIQLFTVGEREPEAEFPDTMIELPILVAGEADGTFDRPDYLLFYGRAVSEWDAQLRTFTNNPYTRQNVYWLTWGAARGRRMMEGLGIPMPGASVRTTGLARQHVEEDLDCPARSGLLWIWTVMNKVRAAPALSASFALGLPLPQAITSLSGRLYSATGYNRLQISLNGRLLDTACFGARPYSNPLDFELRYDTVACPGVDSLSNTLTLTLSGDSNMLVYVDYFDLSLVERLRLTNGTLRFFVIESTPQTFAVTGLAGEPLILNLDDPHAPHVITGWRRQGDSVVFRDVVNDTASYLITDLAALRRPARIERRTPGRLRSPGFTADYVIVAPEQLFDAAQVLERYRTNNVPGLHSVKVRTVRLTEVYDDFSFGREEPVAIRQFFRRVRPAYGLLLGDATYDYRDRLGLRTHAGVPPYEMGYDVNPSGYAGIAYSMDGWYSDFDGSGFTPDMMLGRVTARTAEECRQFIRKLMRYESGRYGAWCKRAILLADDEFLGYYGTPDPIRFDHIWFSETIASSLGSGIEPVKIYLTEYPFTAFGEKPAARDALVREVRRGALLWCFFGHGAADGLTRENAMNLQTVPLLTNGDQVPFCFFGSCAVGRWEDTRSECIAEELARLPDGGAIATVGASKSTPSNSNFVYAQRLFSELLANPGSSLGRAFVLATPNLPIHHLFGDPATRLALPDSGGRVACRDTVQPGRFYSFAGTVPFGQGYASLTLFGPKWLRSYFSWDTLVRPRPLTYVLPGHELYRGTVRVGERSFHGTTMVPASVARGTRLVQDGSYIEIAGSARLSVAAWQPNQAGTGPLLLGLVRDGLQLDTARVTASDSIGPEISLFAEGRKLRLGDTNSVAPSFTLTGQVSDTSGVLLSPPPAGDAFYLYVGDYRNRAELEDRFIYDLGSSTRGSFSYPIALSGPGDSITVVATDNFLNRTSVRVLVRARSESELAISTPLVYPSPLRDHGYFTFYLSAASSVTVRVFSLSGRLLRTLELPDATPGFNRLAWDGCDRGDVALPNGIYLYAITARATGTSAAAESRSVTIRDRFIVRR
jgi:hypothetical protein